MAQNRCNMLSCGAWAVLLVTLLPLLRRVNGAFPEVHFDVANEAVTKYAYEGGEDGLAANPGSVQVLTILPGGNVLIVATCTWVDHDAPSSVLCVWVMNSDATVLLSRRYYDFAPLFNFSSCISAVATNDNRALLVVSGTRNALALLFLNDNGERVSDMHQLQESDNVESTQIFKNGAAVLRIKANSNNARYLLMRSGTDASIWTRYDISTSFKFLSSVMSASYVLTLLMAQSCSEQSAACLSTITVTGLVVRPSTLTVKTVSWMRSANFFQFYSAPIGSANENFIVAFNSRFGYPDPANPTNSWFITRSLLEYSVVDAASGTISPTTTLRDDANSGTKSDFMSCGASSVGAVLGYCVRRWTGSSWMYTPFALIVLPTVTHTVPLTSSEYTQASIISIVAIDSGAFVIVMYLTPSYFVYTLSPTGSIVFLQSVGSLSDSPLPMGNDALLYSTTVTYNNNILTHDMKLLEGGVLLKSYSVSTEPSTGQSMSSNGVYALPGGTAAAAFFSIVNGSLSSVFWHVTFTPPSHTVPPTSGTVIMLQQDQPLRRKRCIPHNWRLCQCGQVTMAVGHGITAFRIVCCDVGCGDSPRFDSRP